MTERIPEIEILDEPVPEVDLESPIVVDTTAPATDNGGSLIGGMTPGPAGVDS